MTATRTTTRGARFYTIDGVEYPSVTTILTAVAKPALVGWAAKTERELVMQESWNLLELWLASGVSDWTAREDRWMEELSARLTRTKAYERESTKALEIGTLVHTMIKQDLEFELSATPILPLHDVHTVPPEAWSAWEQWQAWRQSVRLKPLAAEQVVHSKTYGYAGTLDLLAEVDGRLSVVDFKTSKKVYPEMGWQVAAYCVALKHTKDREAVFAENEYAGLVVRLPKVPGDGFEVLDVTDAPFGAFLAALELWRHMNGEKT